MSLSAVRPYIRQQLSPIGLREHRDAFDDLNREQSKLDKLYRLEVGTISGEAANQSVHEFSYPVNLVISLKGNRDNVALVDRALDVAEDVFGALLPESVRIGTDVKNITPGAVTIEPMDGSDDQDVLLTMEFVVTILCQF